jgi:hypothetical protein
MRALGATALTHACTMVIFLMLVLFFSCVSIVAYFLNGFWANARTRIVFVFFVSHLLRGLEKKTRYFVFPAKRKNERNKFSLSGKNTVRE